MLLTDLPRHHSAEVRLLLITADGTYPLSQIAPHYVIVAKALELPPCDAEVVMQVDGAEDRWPVRLVEGVRASDEVVAIDPR